MGGCLEVMVGMVGRGGLEGLHICFLFFSNRGSKRKQKNKTSSVTSVRPERDHMLSLACLGSPFQRSERCQSFFSPLKLKPGARAYVLSDYLC